MAAKPFESRTNRSGPDHLIAGPFETRTQKVSERWPFESRTIRCNSISKRKSVRISAFSGYRASGYWILIVLISVAIAAKACYRPAQTFKTSNIQYTSESRTCLRGRMVVSDTKKVRLSNGKNKMADTIRKPEIPIRTLV